MFGQDGAQRHGYHDAMTNQNGSQRHNFPYIVRKGQEQSPSSLYTFIFVVVFVVVIVVVVVVVLRHI